MLLRLIVIACLLFSVPAPAARAAATTRPTALPAAPTTLPFGLGVNIHFTSPRPGEMEMLAGGGFTFVRMDFDWAAIEKQRGKYYFSAYETLLDSLEPHGIRALLILDYANPLYDDNRSPDSDEGRRAFARWAAAAAKHFRGRGILWEMYNEPNISPFWRPKPNTDDYIKLALEVGKAIKAAAPQEAYVGPATSGFDWPFLEACFKAGLLDYWSAVTVHPYRQQPPETAADDYRKLRLLISKYAPQGRAIPIYSGEWGYSAAWASYDVEKQGVMLARQWLTNIANDVPLSIWYDWHDDGPDPKEPEHHFGTVEHPYREGQSPVYTPKPAYVAAKKLVDELNGFSFNKRLWLANDDDHVLLFTRGEQAKVVAWTTASESRRVDVPGLLDVTLTREVRYLVPQSSPQLLKLIRWERAPLDRVIDAPADLNGRTITRGQRALTIDHPFADQVAIKQRTIVTVSNAITMTVCAPRTWFEVHLSNPSGQPFDGRLTLNDLDSVAVQLKKGQTFGEFSLPTIPGADQRVRLKLVDRDGTLLIESPTLRLQNVPFFGRDEIAVRPGGDKDVKSSQSFDSGGAPVILRVAYDFEPGWKFVTVESVDGKPAPLAGKPARLAMWVQGDGSGNMLRARFVDSTGQTFQPDGPRLDFTDWRHVAFALDETAKGRWGGANDGIVHYPIRLDALLLIDNVSRAKTQGAVEVMMPALIYEE